MADSVLPTKLAKHASKAALTPSKPDAMPKSKKTSSARAAARGKETEKTPSTKSTKPKPKKGDSTAEIAVTEPAPPVANPAKDRKDKRFSGLTPEAKQARRREDRQRKHQALEAAKSVNLADALARVSKPTSTALSKPRPAVERSSVLAKRGREKQSKAKEWKVSQPIGGRYSTNNLVYSLDEKYILLAQGPAIKVFSTHTSLLYRTLQHLHPPATPFPYVPVGSYSNIANYTLDPVNPSQLYTLTFAGDLLLWDWTEGTIEGYWKTDLHSSQYLAWCGLHVLPSSKDADSQSTTLWTYHEHSLRDPSRKAQREIRALAVPRSPDPAATALSSSLIFAFEDTRPRNLVIVDAQTFVIDAGDAFYIGNRRKRVAQEDSSSEWRMRRVTVPEKIISIDAIARHKKSGGGIQGDVAVGDNTGQIFIHHDILSPATSSSSAQSVVKSKLHWHRTGVDCIKYSKDGTYLISGGRETVLVIWQLTTSSQQHLPNLGAAIKNIVLSPSGTSYALILADNSVLAISTAELKPITSIAGIQSRISLSDEHRIYAKGGKVCLRPAYTAAAVSSASEWRIPCVKNPRDAMQILLAAPSNQKGGSEYPYMQTFDLSQDRGVGKQALTRTLASFKNSNPDGGRVREPNVRFLSVSGDGEWLASVDEWTASAKDFINPAAPQPKHTARVAKEISLRFWRWAADKENNGSGGTWELVSMIESPHGVLPNGSAGDVADLTASPHGSTFASVGSDGTIKIWGHRARTRAGVAVQKSSLVVWHCRCNVELFKAAPNALQHGRIAYAADGSVVAVAYQDAEASASASTVGNTGTSGGADDDGVIAVIDPTAGRVVQEISGAQTGAVFALTFVDRYLVIAGAARLVVWDLVRGCARWASELRPLVGRKVQLDSADFVANIHVAADAAGGTFAVAVNYPRARSDGDAGKRKGLTRAGNTASVVTVFSIATGFEVLCRQKAAHGVLALENTVGGGYFWLDGAANVYFLSNGGVVSGGARGGYLEGLDAVGGLANAFLEKAVIEADAGDDDDADDVREDEDGDGRVVRSHMLAKLFPVPAYASPAVGDVFGRFMEIVGEKALDVPRPIDAGQTSGLLTEISHADLVGDHEEDEDDDDEDEDDDEKFEDAVEGGAKDVYADLPDRGFDIIIDKVEP